MSVLSIDPGVHLCACAMAHRVWTSKIEWVRFATPESFARWDRAEKPTQVVVERPEYQGARSDHARMQNVIDLTWAGAQAAYSLGVPVIELTPTQWKGSEAKPPQHLRLWEDCLTPDERKLFPEGTSTRIMQAAERYAMNPAKYPSAEAYGKGKGSEVHNLLDAAALLLKHLGRFR